METYKNAVEAFEKAQRSFTEAKLAFDERKHGIRAKLYAEKLEGVKYTEEHIRSMSVMGSLVESENYERALADLEIAKVRLEFEKSIYNQGE